MNNYTMETQRWLDQRFRAVNASGVYIAHQPIYGFRALPCDQNPFNKYVISYEILKALSRLDFQSLLDVGGSEGYKAAMIRDTFGVEVQSCDLSQEACSRAQEIFGIESRQVDAQDLPYEDGSFDVVLSSETMEHVQDIEKAMAELIRVARFAVVVTVPLETQETVEKNIKSGKPHEHIQSLRPDSFDAETLGVHSIRSKRILSSLLSIPRSLVGAVRITSSPGYPAVVLRAFNALTPVLQKLFGMRAAACLVGADTLLCRAVPVSKHVIYVLIKNPECQRDTDRVPIRLKDVIAFKVPPYVLRKG